MCCVFPVYNGCMPDIKKVMHITYPIVKRQNNHCLSEYHHSLDHEITEFYKAIKF
jgi:hypothetical protein